MPGNWKSSSAMALTALVIVTAIWGSTFIVVQNAVSRMPVMDFLAWRFSIAVLVMLAIRPRALRGISRVGWLRGAILGGVLGLGYITQTYGLRYASATVTGFITGMFVVLTPVLSLFILRRKVNLNTWLAVLLATVGLALLSLYGWSVGIGEMLALACAFCYALHIIGLGEWSSQHDTYGFSLIQLFFVAGICLAVAAPGGLVVPPDIGVWVAVGVTAVLATAFAFFVQTWAQALVPPTRAAVVMTMEPVFAGIFGVTLGDNQLTPRIIGGAACVLAGMFLAQLKSPYCSTQVNNSKEN